MATGIILSSLIVLSAGLMILLIKRKTPGGPKIGRLISIAMLVIGVSTAMYTCGTDATHQKETSIFRWEVSTESVASPGSEHIVHFLAVNQEGVEVSASGPNMGQDNPFIVLDTKKESSGYYKVTVRYLAGDALDLWKSRHTRDFVIIESQGESNSGFPVKISDTLEPIWHGVFHNHSKDHFEQDLNSLPVSELCRMNRRLFHFYAISDHVRFPYLDEKMFCDQCNMLDQENVDGSFITFKGYELMNTQQTLHTSILFKDKAVYHNEETGLNVNTLRPILDSEVGSKDYLVISHGHALGNDKWQFHPEGFEAYSFWNIHNQIEEQRTSYDAFYQRPTILDGIVRGFKFFVTGDTDAHTWKGRLVLRRGYVPKSNWKKDSLPYGGAHALTYIQAQELTRNSLWDGLLSKNTYASTMGVFLDFVLLKDDRAQARVTQYSRGTYSIQAEVIHSGTGTLYVYRCRNGVVEAISSATYDTRGTIDLAIAPRAGDVYWLEGYSDTGYDFYIATPYWVR